MKKAVNKALITGASSGIGRELALLLAERGIELIVHGRDKLALQALADEIGTKTKVTQVVAELASFEGTQSVIKVLQESYPDLVINNAGFGLYGDLHTQGPQEVQTMIAVNCAAIVAICQHICFWWKEDKIQGTILNVSSALSFMPAPGGCVYGATKAFVSSFSEALDVELEQYGIRVLTACPGRVATPFSVRASKGKRPAPFAGGMVLDPKEVARSMLEQIDRREPLRIIDWKYRLLLFVRRFIPKRLAMKRLYKSLKSRAA